MRFTETIGNIVARLDPKAQKQVLDLVAKALFIDIFYKIYSAPIDLINATTEGFKKILTDKEANKLFIDNSKDIGEFALDTVGKLIDFTKQKDVGSAIGKLIITIITAPVVLPWMAANITTTKINDTIIKLIASNLEFVSTVGKMINNPSEASKYLKNSEIDVDKITEGNVKQVESKPTVQAEPKQINQQPNLAEPTTKLVEPTTKLADSTTYMGGAVSLANALFAKLLIMVIFVIALVIWLIRNEHKKTEFGSPLDKVLVGVGSIFIIFAVLL